MTLLAGGGTATAVTMVEHMRGQMEELVAAELWDSAEILGGFLCSASADGDSVPPADRAIHLVRPGVPRCCVARHVVGCHVTQETRV